MRLKLFFKLRKPELPLEYRKTFLSFIKSVFDKGAPDLYSKFYKNKSVMKPFTFGVYLPHPTFKEDKIEIRGREITMNFSTASRELGEKFHYTLLTKQLNFCYLPNENQMDFHKVIEVEEQQVKDETIVIKTLSPLLVRKTKKYCSEDFYLIPGEEEFSELFTISAENILSSLKKSSGTVTIEPLKPKIRKVPVKHYGRILEASTGMFMLTGAKEDLKFLYRAGIGSRRSEGFGMFEIVG